VVLRRGQVLGRRAQEACEIWAKRAAAGAQRRRERVVVGAGAGGGGPANFGPRGPQNLPLWTSIYSINSELAKFAKNHESQNVLFYDATSLFATRTSQTQFTLLSDQISHRGHPTEAGYKTWEDSIASKCKAIVQKQKRLEKEKQQEEENKPFHEQALDMVNDFVKDPLGFMNDDDEYFREGLTDDLYGNDEYGDDLFNRFGDDDGIDWQEGDGGGDDDFVRSNNDGAADDDRGAADDDKRL